MLPYTTQQPTESDLFFSAKGRPFLTATWVVLCYSARQKLSENDVIRLQERCHSSTTVLNCVLKTAPLDWWLDVFLVSSTSLFPFGWHGTCKWQRSRIVPFQKVVWLSAEILQKDNLVRKGRMQSNEGVCLWPLWQPWHLSCLWRELFTLQILQPGKGLGNTWRYTRGDIFWVLHIGLSKRKKKNHILTLERYSKIQF